MGLKNVKDSIGFELWKFSLLFSNKKGQATDMPIIKIIALMIALLVAGAVAWIMLGATKQGERAVLNFTRIWRYG